MSFLVIKEVLSIEKLSSHLLFYKRRHSDFNFEIIDRGKFIEVIIYAEENRIIN